MRRCQLQAPNAGILEESILTPSIDIVIDIDANINGGPSDDLHTEQCHPSDLKTIRKLSSATGTSKLKEIKKLRKPAKEKLSEEGKRQKRLLHRQKIETVWMLESDFI
ncbi:unnamed protein product [Orchesella dallaii]|uniref:Uncharacterized protein n=1 Tax=Orchesella dallaii TaxID=48710 RepID=A0ABP1Q718_9HEXA